MNEVTAHIGSLAQLLAQCPGVTVNNVPDIPITGLTLDSRRVKPGDLFVAVPGTGGKHGLRFADMARKAGAAAIVYEPVVPIEVPIPSDAISVPNISAHLGRLAHVFYGKPSAELNVIGVTGTNGKTSIVQFLTQAWALIGVSAGSIGTLGAGLGDQLQSTGLTTPDVIQVHALLAQLKAQGARAVAMEVSSHALDQGRVDAVQFDIAVFSNLTQDHLDYHHDMAAYGAAKAKLFQARRLKAAVINVDDPFGCTLANPLAEKLCVIGHSSHGHKHATIRAENVVLDSCGIHFDLWINEQFGRVHSPLLGRFNIDNLLAVAAILHIQQQNRGRIVEMLSQLTPICGRMNRMGNNNQPTVVIDYAHTPDALKQALVSLRAHLQQKNAVSRLFCVFGCGGERDRDKRAQMARIAEQHADSVWVTDDNPRHEDGQAIIADILAGFTDAKLMMERGQLRVERDREQAISAAIGQAQVGDMVLIAGKGHETYQEINGIKHPFDDSVIATRALAQRATQ